MKKVPMIQRAGRLTGMVWVIGLAFFSTSLSSNAAQMSEARVTQVIQDVKLLPSNAAPRPAAINDNVREGTAVRTGQDSRTELTFSDLTLTRLGANSVFSFNAATRTLDLGQGSVLMQVPPNSPAVKVKTAAVTAAITGGTAIFGSGPPPKFMIMEGTGTFYPTGHPEEAVTLHGGEMLTLVDGKFVKQEFDVKLVLQTSELIVPFSELANLALIWNVVFQQEGNDVHDFSDKNTKDNTDQTDQAQNANPSPGPSGPPSEFGPPTTISSPNPYVISSGTTINTDPTITTNGVTDFGTFYRGTAVDGTPTQFLFGEAPNAVDQVVFDGPQNNLPVAVFKFASLQLTGDPTVVVPAGGANNLALVSVGDITSGGPGGTLTFSGIPRLDLLTQNGSINLGAEISFNIPHLSLYARGNNSNLTLGSAVSASEVLKLYAGGTIQVNGAVSTPSFVAFSGGDFLVGSGVITANDIDIESLSNINIDSSLFPDPPGGGGSVIFNAANTLNLQINGGGTFGWDTLFAQATTINLTTSDGVVTFDFSNSSAVSFIAGSGGINAYNIDLNGGGNLTATANAGDVTPTGGDITFHGINLSGSVTGSDTVTAGNSLSILNNVTINRTNGGTTSGLNVTFSAGTDLMVGGNLSIATDASNIATGGNIVVTSGADMTSGGSMTIGGDFTLFIGAATGTTTGVGGNINVTSGGSLTAGSLDFNLFFDDSAQVTDGENLTLTVTNDLLTTAGGVSLMLSTPVGPDRPLLINGGNISMTIGGDVTLASGGDLNLTMINNEVDQVNTGGNIFASIGGSLTADRVSALLTNYDTGIIGTGGNLTFTVGGSLTASSVSMQIDNSDGGHITDGGNITFHVGTALMTTGDANFLLLNGGGTIDSDVLVDIKAGSISVGGSLNAYIDNSGGSIGESGGSLQLESVGAITVTDNLHVLGNVIAGGNITAGTVSTSTITAPTAILTAGAGGITPFVADFAGGAALQHTFTVNSIVSPKGIDFSGNQFGGIAGLSSGGLLTINATTIDFNAFTGILFANFNGADAGGFDDGETPASAGSGGTFIVNATGNITTVSGSDITATTGQNFPNSDPESSTFSGAGGTVELNSSAGSVTVDSRIEVSSAEPQSTVAPFRASASGGHITIHSGLTTGSAIYLSTNAQLLSNLDPQAPGPGGSIMVTTAGGDIQVGQDFANDAVLEADRGTITLQTFDNALAQITIDCASFIAETVNIISSGDLSLGGIDPAPIDATTILLSAAHDLTWNGQSTIKFAFDSVGNVTVSAGNDLTIFSDTTIWRMNAGQTDGLNIELSAGNNLTFYGSLTLRTQPGGVDTGGNISILAGTETSGGSIMGIGDPANVTMATIVESDMGTGANIKMDADGSITIGTLTASVEVGALTASSSTSGTRAFLPGITLSDGGNIDINAGGDFTATDTVNGVQLVVDASSGNNTITTGGNISVTTGGNFTAQKLSALIDLSNGGAIGSGGAITFDIGGTLSTTGDANFTISEGGAATVPPERAINVTANSIDVGGNLNGYIDNSTGGSPTTDDGSAVQIESFGGITVTGRLNVLGTVLADDDVYVGTLSVTDLDTQGNNTTVGAGGITPFNVPGQLAPDILNMITTRVLTDTGGINFNGIDADGDFSTATNAGRLTINALSLSFGVEANIDGSVTFNGGDGSSTFAPGSGGTFTVNTTNNITVDSPIEATSGYIQPFTGQEPAGDGGTVNLNSTNGTVTVTDRIEVSSAEPTSTVAPFRQSAKGGNIGITSAKASAVAINIGSTAQLLSYLDGAAAGPGGTITISATGDNSTINVNNAEGLIEADGGEIDIQNHGAGGMINITNASMSADVIKIQVLGLDGTLKIGGGIISADSALNLYAAGSNGTIEFTASVTLNSGVAAVIAANTVTIDNSVTVTINSPALAQIYTNNPHYAVSSGGDGTTTGVFAGTGAPTTTQPFPPPGGPAAAATTTSSTSSSSLVSKQSQTMVTSASAIPSGSQLKKQSLSALSSTKRTTLAARQLISNSGISPRRQTSLAAAKTTINVANSAQLSSMLESATQSGNKVTYVAKPQSTSGEKGSVVRTSQITPASGTSGSNVTAKGGNDANVAIERVTNFTNTNLGRPVNTASY